MSTEWNPEVGKSLLPIDISHGKRLFTEWDGQGVTLTRNMSLAWGPSEIGNSNDYSHLWATYLDSQTGEIWIAKLDTTFQEWGDFQKIDNLPKEAKCPSLSWDSFGRYNLGFEMLRHESGASEVWISKPPYREDSIRKIDYGKSPILGNDAYGGIYFAYLSQDEKIIYLRHSDGEYENRVVLKSSDYSLELLGYRNWGVEVTPLHDQYRYLLFYRDKSDGYWPDYLMTSPVNLHSDWSDFTGKIRDVGTDKIYRYKLQIADGGLQLLWGRVIE